MHKLVISNLPSTSTIKDLSCLLQRFALHYIAIQFKDKEAVAIVDFPDQSCADKALEALSGYFHEGIPLKVEPHVAPRSSSNNKKEGANRLVIKNVDVSGWAPLQQLLSTYGTVKSFQKVTSGRTSSNKLNDDQESSPDQTQCPSEDDCTVVAVFNNSEATKHAYSQLRDLVFCNKTLQVSLEMTDRSAPPQQQQQRMAVPRRGRSEGGGPPVGRPSGSAIGGGAGTDFPLRMVVDARFVGAIIGQGGSKIREITKESKARCVVDVNRGVRDQAGNVEKVINIYGQPENCSRACMKILEVVQSEMEKESNGQPVDMELKLRAHNQLVGRLIGKGGQTIKKIMEDTNCTVFVSNENELVPVASTKYNQRGFSSSTVASESLLGLNVASGGGYNPSVPAYSASIGEINAFNMERTITIRGAIVDIEKAELLISSKLRQSFEHDMSTPNAMFGGGHPLMGGGMLSGGAAAMAGAPGGGVGIGAEYGGPYVSPAVPYAGGPVAAAAGYAARAQEPVITEVVHMWVPNAVVGALIGTRGVHIRNVMRMTGAHIRIEGGGGRGGDQGVGGGATGDASAGGGRGGGRYNNQQQQDQDDRLVTITGTADQQYKAQFYVYQRLCEQGYQFFEDVRLCTEVSVPTKLVGRIIGKGGQNVRELQRLTGAAVKIPEGAETEDSEETIVRVVGNFNAAWAVQSRIRQLLGQYHQQASSMPINRAGGGPNGGVN